MRRTVWHQLRWKLAVGLIAAAYVVTLIGMQAAVPAPDNGVGVDLSNMPTLARPLTTGSPAALVVEHGCWTRAEGPPADMVGVLPGHSVVTLPNGDTVYVGADLTGAALEQEINGVDNGLIVRGFCR
ncbi:hypothetical protein [Nocardioides sp. InS609-2]|uniref:hypothetical protein n=1 Tax=Nocardioides sp. InS609-2 TaxID=2760705 RepID=UPI0020C045A4|nr:hypothetical protein [Nocardioides sp. InS609-2]